MPITIALYESFQEYCLKKHSTLEGEVNINIEPSSNTKLFLLQEVSYTTNSSNKTLLFFNISTKFETVYNALI